MSLYLDTSVLVALAVAEDATPAAHTAILGQALVVSDFAIGEFASALSRKVRMREMSAKDAQALFDAFDAWTAQETARVEIDAADTANAIALVRKFELGLRMPDAMHVAKAMTLRASLFTLDEDMAAAARGLGVPVVG